MNRCRAHASWSIDPTRAWNGLLSFPFLHQCGVLNQVPNRGGPQKVMKKVSFKIDTYLCCYLWDSSSISTDRMSYKSLSLDFISYLLFTIRTTTERKRKTYSEFEAFEKFFFKLWFLQKIFSFKTEMDRYKNFMTNFFIFSSRKKYFTFIYFFKIFFFNFCEWKSINFFPLSNLELERAQAWARRPRPKSWACSTR